MSNVFVSARSGIRPRRKRERCCRLRSDALLQRGAQGARRNFHAMLHYGLCGQLAQALLASISGAGLCVRRLLNASTAVALAYWHERKLHGWTSDARVLVVHCGARCIETAYVTIKSEEVRYCNFLLAMEATERDEAIHQESTYSFYPDRNLDSGARAPHDG